MIYRAYRQKIEDFGYSPSNQKDEARRFLAVAQNSIPVCINATLDEVEYKLKRLTKAGLAALIAETSLGSASFHALLLLNDPDTLNTKIVELALELISLYNHSLRCHLC